MPQIRTLILLKSVHCRNTQQVSDAMAGVVQATVLAPVEVTPATLMDYDLIGFGSGVYFGRFHRELRTWVKRLRPLADRQAAFVFSTAGLSFLGPIWHRSLRRQLNRRNFNVIGEFSCPGHDLVGPLRLVGGLNRGRPNQVDLQRAQEFAAALREKAVDLKKTAQAGRVSDPLAR